MTPEQITSLQAEMIEDPVAMGYDQWIPNGPGHLVELLNAKTRSIVRERFVTARGILAELPLTDAATFLETLEALSASNAVVKWGLYFLKTDGIDIGHANTRLLIDSLVQGGAITQALGDAVKAMALQPGSRAEELFDIDVTEADVRAALVA